MSWAIAKQFEEEILRLKELWAHVDVGANFDKSTTIPVKQVKALKVLKRDQPKDKMALWLQVWGSYCSAKNLLKYWDGRLFQNSGQWWALIWISAVLLYKCRGVKSGR